MVDKMNRQDVLIEDLSSRLNLVFPDNELKKVESKSHKTQLHAIFCELFLAHLESD